MLSRANADSAVCKEEALVHPREVDARLARWGEDWWLGPEVRRSALPGKCCRDDQCAEVFLVKSEREAGSQIHILFTVRYCDRSARFSSAAALPHSTRPTYTSGPDQRKL
jgi:hypothetical protein